MWTILIKLSILVAEDNELNFEIVQFMMDVAGANVIAAKDGKQAVDIFNASEIGGGTHRSFVRPHFFGFGRALRKGEKRLRFSYRRFERVCGILKLFYNKTAADGV